MIDGFATFGSGAATGAAETEWIPSRSAIAIAALTGWIPIAGDWDGNSTDTVGLYNPALSRFYLRNTNSNGVADNTFLFGASTETVLSVLLIKAVDAWALSDENASLFMMGHLMSLHTVQAMWQAIFSTLFQTMTAGCARGQGRTSWWRGRSSSAAGWS